MVEPRVLKRTKSPIVLADYKRRSAIEDDFNDLITEPTIIYDETEEKVKIVYLELVDNHRPLVAALKKIDYRRDSRTSGMLTESRTFGYLPRTTLRRDFCTTSLLAHEQPKAHEMVMSYAERVSTYYEQYEPELYSEHQREVERILPDYKIDKTVFTSGIINKNNPLPYHHDAGNIRNVWSNMLVFKNRIEGGYLCVPEYDCAFELKDNSLLMFDGQNLLHGVTPIKKKHKDSHRFSIVFYSMQKMWNCLPPEQEIERIRKIRQEREFRRLEKMDEADKIKATEGEIEREEESKAQIREVP